MNFADWPRGMLSDVQLRAFLAPGVSCLFPPAYQPYPPYPPYQPYLPISPLSKDLLRDGLQLQVGCAFVDLSDLGVAEQLLDRVVLDETVATEEIHR